MRYGGALALRRRRSSCRPLPGFSLAACDPLRADAVLQVVSWRRKSDVRKFSGQVVRVRIVLQDARLFAMQFVR